jgi:hypothetical protein
MPIHITKTPEDYKIVRSPDLSDLEQQCLEFLDAGWEPIGGISVIPNNTINTFCQAFIKYKTTVDDTGPM